MEKEYKIGIIGLGYVGLPLSLAFSEHHTVVGFDIDKNRVHELNNNYDVNYDNNVKSPSNLIYTYDSNLLSDIEIYIITVPTPILADNKPDLSFLKSATQIIAPYIKKDNIIIYESTVYPGVTEDYCMPIIENISGLCFNIDFFCGYSPERISPGDSAFSLDKMIKITSGSNIIIAEIVDNLYKQVISAGTYKAPSIRVAEAAKIIENIQRDVNIALINELAIIFDGMKIDSREVLKAARTKKNFIDFQPGLVGGHCISVDPYYLSYQSQKLGISADIITLAREINNNVSNFIVLKTLEFLKLYNKKVEGSKILILGYTFKENCSDTRNTKVEDIIRQLQKYNIDINIYDPYIVDNQLYDVIKNPFLVEDEYDAIIVAVAHNEFKKYNLNDFTKISKGKLVLLDIKGIYEYSTWKL